MVSPKQMGLDTTLNIKYIFMKKNKESGYPLIESYASAIQALRL